MSTHITQLIAAITLLALCATVHAQQRQWVYVLTNDLDTVSLRYEGVAQSTGVVGQDRDGTDQHFDLTDFRTLWFHSTQIPVVDSLGPSDVEGSFVVVLTDGNACG